LELWLDNSYNERMISDSPEKLVVLAERLNADKIIAPDSPAWSTAQITQSYLETSQLSRKQTIVVVSSLSMLNDLKRMGAKDFALSYWVRPLLTEEELDEMKECHFLGCLSIDELKRFKPPSCDTSMPIKLAIQGKDINQWIKEGCPHIHTKDLGFEGRGFFYFDLTLEQVKLARENIISLKERANE
jgi:hypothetical protein